MHRCSLLSSAFGGLLRAGGRDVREQSAIVLLEFGDDETSMRDARVSA